jgi:type 1 glutamine amidotransferase
MRRLIQSGFVFVLVSGFAACSGDDTVPDSPMSAATGGVGTSAGGATGGNSPATGGVAMTPTGGSAPLGGQSAGGASAAGTGGSSPITGGATTTGGTAGAPNSQGGTGGGSGGTAGGGGSPGAGRGGGGAGNDAGVGGVAGNAGGGGAPPTRPARVLLYSFSTLNIPSVPAQLDILEQQLEGWQFEVDRSVDPAVFTDQNLAKYAAVGMINTCFSPFGANRSGEAEAQALQKFLQAGGGLFGTHCADVTFQSADPVHLYNRLIGGRASSENFEGESDCSKMGDHPTIAALPATFVYNGNLDNTDFLGTDASVLVRCKWKGGGQKDIAVSWVRNEGSGRVFFSNFAKVDTDFTNPTIGQNHLLAGLGWVLGR